MEDSKIKITKISKNYYEHHYDINIDIPKTINLKNFDYNETEEEYIYHFQYWTLVVSGSWNRKYSNKLRTYEPVYKNCKNKYMTLKGFSIKDTDSVKVAQEKVNNSEWFN